MSTANTRITDCFKQLEAKVNEQRDAIAELVEALAPFSDEHGNYGPTLIVHLRKANELVKKYREAK